MSWASAIKERPVALEQFVEVTYPTEVVDWARLVTLDFETYYDADYTLSKLSTSEYIRDKRFKAQMVGIKIGEKPTRVYPAKAVAAALRRIPWATHSLLCHNTQFDAFILSHHYGIQPKKLYCTLSMARGLHSNEIGAGLDEVSKFYGGSGKIEGGLEPTKGVLNWPAALVKSAGIYCANDVDECFRIFKLMVPKMPRDEIDLIDITVRMFTDPVLKVDLPRVQAELIREVERREVLMMSILKLIDQSDPDLFKGWKREEKALTGKERDLLIVKKHVGSNEKFAALLRKQGVAEIPRKISPAWMKKPVAERKDEDKYSYAFAKDDIAFINLPDTPKAWATDLDMAKKQSVMQMAVRSAVLRTLVDTRIAVKSTTNITRAERFLTAGANGMPLPCGYAYYRAHTGRWGGNNKMNMQNLTRGGELRQSILAPKGHQIAVVDSGQIEARINGWLWGQHDLLDAFRAADTGSGRDAYCLMGDLVYGRPIDKKKDPNERFVGKVCVAGDTRVLTNHGIKTIIEVRSNDLLWDGVAWVQHKGLINQGVQETLTYRGLCATPDHEILTARGWLEWSEVLTDHSLFQSALGSASLPLSDGTIIRPPMESLGAIGLSAVVRAGASPWFTPAASSKAERLAAMLAPRSQPTQNATGFINTLCRKMSTALGYSTGSLQQSAVAIIRATRRLSTMVREVSRSPWNGSTTVPLSYFMPEPSLVGTYLHLKWTALKRIWGMPPETFALPPNLRTRPINGELKIWSNASEISRQRTPTYDLVDAGPRHRFTVFTEDGPLVIHNCVLALGFQMGPHKFQMTLAKGALGGPPVYFTIDECRKIVDTYRRKNSRIVTGWDKCKAIIEDMAAGREGSYKCLSWGEGYILLPNGMTLKYPNLKKSISADTGWDEWSYQSGDTRKKIYGGLLCENIVQALARIVVGTQILTISRKLRVVMTTHDEVATVVKTPAAPKSFDFMLAAFRTPPAWCADIPLNAEGGFAVNYSK